jgi:hypothetical protein
VTPGLVTGVVAGVDVGNSTTEVVLVEPGAVPRPVAWDRAPTRGRKGSAGAARAAADLVARTARRAGVRVGAAVVAPQRAVDTTTVDVERAAPDLAPLVAVTAGRARTPGRPGLGSGRPVPVTAQPPAGEPVVLVVPPDVGFRAAADRLGALLAAGTAVAAVVVGADEGVLLARRVPGLPEGVPVADGADTAAALACERLLVEVAAPDGLLRAAVDPLHLVAAFGLGDAERDVARAAAGVLADRRAVVVGLDRSRRPAASPPGPAADADDSLVAWTVDLDAVVIDVEGRRGEPLGAVRAVLEATAATDGVADVVAAALGVPVVVAPSEAAAARAGALTTPGARPDAVVLDLGGGTLDLMPDDTAELVAAGAGELVTAAVARLAGCSRGAADWVKRGPASRLEGPHVLVGEDGERRFAERAAPADAVGSLVVPGPAGLLPFGRTLAPAEWRALRLRAKRVALGDNVSRLVTAAGRSLAGRDVVLVGGVAGDAELLRVLDVALARSAVGRADVAEVLGHRWAVAYGLTVLGGRPG